jgi:hypothetical protein
MISIREFFINKIYFKWKYCFASNEWLMFSDFFGNNNRFESCLALFNGKFLISEAVLYPMVTQRS